MRGGFGDGEGQPRGDCIAYEPLTPAVSGVKQTAVGEHT